MRPLAVISVAVALSVALAAPASAGRTITHDAAGSGGHRADLAKVTVLHGSKRVVVKTRTERKAALAHEMWHVVDTVGDGAPDFLVFSVIHNEVSPQPSVSVRRIAHWPTRKDPYQRLQTGRRVECGLQKAHKSDKARLLTLTLGRGCFATGGQKPERLRLNTFSTWEWGAVTDVVPRWRHYGAWTPGD